MLIPFAVNSYKARALPFSAQRCVNYFAESAPKDAKTPVIVYNAPGIASFSDGLAGAVRGSHRMNGIAYVVAGDRLYSIAATGTETSLGTINTSTGPVSMASNRADPQQLCFVDGTDGWIYDTSSGLQEIVDADFEAADTVTFQDGYFIFSVAGTSKFRISALDDGLDHTATDFAEAESNADEVVAVWSSQQQLWVFKETITEIYYNSGNADFPFERIAGGVIERGCAAAFSIAADDNTLFWLGNDRVIYRAAGAPIRISTHAIEEELRGKDVSDARGWFVTLAGHKFYHLVFPTARLAFVYDVAAQLWHERESFGVRHFRFTTYVEAYGKHLVGDAFQGRVGELDMDTFTEFGGTMQGIMTGPPIHNDRKRVFHRLLEIDIESGVGTTSGQEPQMWLDWSDDGGRTFSVRKPKRSMGKIGEYRQRLRWTRLGSARERVYRLTVADAVKRSVMAAHLNGQEGAH
jgi:hypothetical protein